MPPITVNYEEIDSSTLSLEEMERISNETKEDIEEYEIP